METGGGGDSGDPPEPEQPQINTASVDSVIKYLRTVSSCVLEEDPIGSEALLEKFADATTQDVVRKFINDPQSKAVIVYRSILKDDEGDQEDGGLPEAKYGVDLDVQFVQQKCASVAFIKRGNAIEENKKIGSQIRVLNLDNSSPFETLHSYVSNAVSPFFKSYVKKSGKSARYANKIFYLELFLVYCCLDLSFFETFSTFLKFSRETGQHSMDGVSASLRILYQQVFYCINIYVN